MKLASEKESFPNERTIEELHRDTLQWLELLSFISVEIKFFTSFLEKHINASSDREIIKTGYSFLTTLDEQKSQCLKLDINIRKHQKDILGMRECEDVYCDNFYSQEHKNWHQKLQDFQLIFHKTKSEIFEFTTPVLKYNRN